MAVCTIQNEGMILICRSESPSQVFLILIQWLLSLVKQNGYDIAINAYDNMCNLERLRAVGTPLPLPPPLDKMWMSITKIIVILATM